MDTPAETPEKGLDTKKRKLWTVRTLVIAIILASTIGVAAAVTLFTHTFPAVTSTPPVLTTTCAALIATPATVVTGTSGNVRFSCGASAAFSATTGVVTPTFTLGAGYTSVTIILATDTCPGASAVTLTSGTAVTFSFPVASPGLDDYCLAFSSAPAAGLATFTLTWSQ